MTASCTAAAGNALREATQSSIAAGCRRGLMVGVSALPAERMWFEQRPDAIDRSCAPADQPRRVVDDPVVERRHVVAVTLTGLPQSNDLGFAVSGGDGARSHAWKQP